MYTLLGEMSIDLVLYKQSLTNSSKLKKIDHKIYFEENLLLQTIIFG